MFKEIIFNENKYIIDFSRVMYIHLEVDLNEYELCINFIDKENFKISSENSYELERLYYEIKNYLVK